MYVKVKLLKGFQKPLFYKIPSCIQQQNLTGCILRVPIKNTNVSALVLEEYVKIPKEINFELREALNLEQIPNDLFYKKFTQQISKIFFLDQTYFYKRIRTFLEYKKNYTKHNQEEKTFLKPKKITLTKEQNNVVECLQNYIQNPKYAPTLLHGVTGSGKTEVYSKLIQKNLNAKKSVIFLIPEVSLALQFQNIFKSKLEENVPIFGFHSACSAKEKKNMWQHLLQNIPSLIIGVHLPAILPISNLGLIIVDEEHSTSFQEQKSPKLNSKNLAIYRAYTYNIPILLGSATPSLASINNIKLKNWNLFKLNKRFGGNFPQVQKVELKKTKRKNFWISKELQTEIQLCLNRKEQVLIFLNRRGYSFFVICKECGFVFECPNCSVSLTLHISKKENTQTLQCHYCNYKQQIPKTCPSCKCSDNKFLKKGIGTQQIVSILEKMFPLAKTERADLDTTIKKKKTHEILNRFTKGEINILVGTQTITKGYNFENVTLVGILWADIGLHFPVFNAAETTLQQLIQAAGRAGRQSKSSKVVVQTMNDHDIFNYLNEKDYFKFYEKEIVFRKMLNYPPICYLNQIELRNPNPQTIENEVNIIFDNLIKVAKEQNLNLKILGPVKPAIYKIQTTQIRHIFIKSLNYKTIHQLLSQINFVKFKSKIFINALS
jgi:primosomal protein N' (replication factor Y) (superfamily II helicase)